MDPQKTYRNPCPTVDVLIEQEDGSILLIRRKNPPHGWAIPGGFVDYGETLEAAAIREAKEETSLDVELVALLGVYSDPARDPRLHTISAAFIARAVSGVPEAADDAAALEAFPLDALPAPLCFDHAQILADYARFKADGRRPNPMPPRVDAEPPA